MMQGDSTPPPRHCVAVLEPGLHARRWRGSEPSLCVCRDCASAVHASPWKRHPAAGPPCCVREIASIAALDSACSTLIRHHRDAPKPGVTFSNTFRSPHPAANQPAVSARSHPPSLTSALAPWPCRYFPRSGLHVLPPRNRPSLVSSPPSLSLSPLTPSFTARRSPARPLNLMPALPCNLAARCGG